MPRLMLLIEMVVWIVVAAVDGSIAAGKDPHETLPFKMAIFSDIVSYHHHHEKHHTTDLFSHCLIAMGPSDRRRAFSPII